jgi:hypothetical protein
MPVRGASFNFRDRPNGLFSKAAIATILPHRSITVFLRLPLDAEHQRRLRDPDAHQVNWRVEEIR